MDLSCSMMQLQPSSLEFHQRSQWKFQKSVMKDHRARWPCPRLYGWKWPASRHVLC